MAAVLKHWREAATLLVAAKRTSGKITSLLGKSGTASKDAFDLLLLQRSSKSAFMPNLYVFPGGVASDTDFSPQWQEVFDGCGTRFREDIFSRVQRGGSSPPMFSRKRPEEFCHIPSEVAFRICAIRETFEECGVLLVRRKSDIVTQGSSLLEDKPTLGSADVAASLGDLNQWRRRVDQDAGQFLTMCQELDLVPDLWSLYEWSDWLTPAHEGMYKRGGRRFDTAFYLCCLDHQPDVAHDEGETIHSLWGTPRDVLQSSMEGGAMIAPPQQYELARLLNFHQLNSLLTFAHSRSLQRVERFLPVRVNCKDGLLFLMPGDDLYPASPDVHGDFPVLERPETVEELMKCQRIHRTVICSDAPPDQRQRTCCNVTASAGHVNPIVQDVCADFPKSLL